MYKRTNKFIPPDKKYTRRSISRFELNIQIHISGRGIILFTNNRNKKKCVDTHINTHSERERECAFCMHTEKVCKINQTNQIIHWSNYLLTPKHRSFGTRDWYICVCMCIHNLVSLTMPIEIIILLKEYTKINRTRWKSNNNNNNHITRSMKIEEYHWHY